MWGIENETFALFHNCSPCCISEWRTVDGRFLMVTPYWLLRMDRGWRNIEEEEVDSWNEEDESDDQYISKKEARKIAEDVCKEMFNIKENKYDK